MCTSSKSSKPIPAVLLFGPTACGKTALLESLFTENRYSLPVSAEVVSADSMQVYRGMDIGTAKPDAALLSRLPHHLIDVRNPDEQFTAGDFVHEADRLCPEIAGRGRLPVVSGGTAFYFRNFIFGLPESPPGDPEVRAALQRELEAAGLAPLYQELSRVDPGSAAAIHPNDRYRILRALEVYRACGKPLSSCAVPRVPRDGTDLLVIGLRRDRGELYTRIDARVDLMFDRGLVGEVGRLIAAGYGPGDPGMLAIGYREFFEMAVSGCTTLAGVRSLIKQRSRNYAKRQLTFFSTLPGVRWHDADDAGGIAAEVRQFIGRVFCT